MEKAMRLLRRFRVFICRESGTSLIETVVATAVLGTIAVTFLNGVVITSKAAFETDERATAQSLGQNQMEWARNSTYSNNASGYPAGPIPSGDDYEDYTAMITAEPLNTPDDGIQKITVTVNRSGLLVFTLESYKVQR